MRPQGTGTTIVQVTPRGHASLFAQIGDLGSACPGGVGLTTALVALRGGWVIVGSLPTQNGGISGPGCLIVLDSHGVVRETFTGHGIVGPWDMTALDLGGLSELFVTNVLGGIIGPRSTSHGGTVQRLLIARGGALMGELGLAIAPNGDILTVNGADGNIVETTPGGAQVAVKTIDHNQGGGGNLFGLAVKPGADAVYFVDDFGNDNNLQLFH